MEWDCDSEGKEIPCEHGCNTRTGQCVRLSPSQTCGTNWPTTTATRQYQLCPATTGSYRTFADLMGASYRVNGQLSQVASDVAWFEAKLKSDVSDTFPQPGFPREELKRKSGTEKV